MAGDDLDDFDLERTPYTPADEAERPSAASRPGGATQLSAAPAPVDGGNRLFLLTLAAVALIAFGVLVLLFVVFRQPQKPRPVEMAASAPSPRPLASTDTASPAVAGPLPALDESDGYVRQLAAALSNHPELARWLGQAALVRTLTAVVANVAEGETPRPHLLFLAPAQRFRARGARGRVVADPAGFAGYDRFADAVASVDAAAAASAYRALEPLFDAAYRDLGHSEGGFRQALDGAIAALLATPLPPADAELVPHAIGFRWTDPALEGLTAAQRQFLRIGPRNVSLVQAKLRQLQAALSSGR